MNPTASTFKAHPEPDASCGPAGTARPPPPPGLTGHGGGPGPSFLHPPSPTVLSLCRSGSFHTPPSLFPLEPSLQGSHSPSALLRACVRCPVTPRASPPPVCQPRQPPHCPLLPSLKSPLSPDHPTEDSTSLRSPTPPPTPQLSLSDTKVTYHVLGSPLSLGRQLHVGGDPRPFAPWPHLSAQRTVGAWSAFTW